MPLISAQVDNRLIAWANTTLIVADIPEFDIAFMKVLDGHATLFSLPYRSTLHNLRDVTSVQGILPDEDSRNLVKSGVVSKGKAVIRHHADLRQQPRIGLSSWSRGAGNGVFVGRFAIRRCWRFYFKLS